MSVTRRSASPLAYLGRRDRGVLYSLGVISAVQAASLVGVAWALSIGITSLIDGTDEWMRAVLVGGVSALVRAITVWAHHTVAARAALGTKERLRAELVERALDDPDSAEGPVATIATRGLDELDNYFTVFLPTLVKAAAIPLIAGTEILFADWVSALIVVLTIPLVPVFMTLIGKHTNERVADAIDALERLSHHLVELARGLPVLVGLGRAREQADALRDIAARQHDTTMVTLRTAFLSALALELISTISVAVVAVFIGVRLVYGHMPLELGLFALLLAPECFTPFREAGKAFHASEEGMESLERVRRALDAEPGGAVVEAGALPARVVELSVTYPDRDVPAVDSISFTLPPGRMVLLDGPSGSGKSTVFAVLAGRLRNHPDSARIEGTVAVDVEHRAWLPQRPRTVADSARAELELYGGESAADDAEEVLDALDLTHVAASNPALLSPGELRRLGFGRVLMRVRDGARLALLDEPTAHLDAHSARLVLHEITAMRKRGVAILVASHDARVRALVDSTVTLAGGSQYTATTDDTERNAPAAPAQRETVGESHSPSAARELVAFLRPVAGRFVAAAVVGTLAAIFAVSLTGVSAWLIVKAAEQPPILLLMTAIVGVRFFGIGRAVLRYAERLLTHSAVFTAIGELRTRLWRSLSARGVLDRTALEGGRALDRVVRDADQVRDLSVRVVQPVAVAVLTSASVLAAVALIHPGALGAYAVALAVSLIVAPLVALVADRAASRSGHRLRSRVLRRFASIIAAADDLRANRIDGRARSDLARLDAAASRTAQRGALALGLGNAVLVLAGAVLAVAIIPLTASAVASGELDGALVAVLALIPLGVIEVLLDHVAAIQQAPALREALTRVASTTTAPVPRSGSRRLEGSIRSLELDAVAAAWPGMLTPLASDISLRLTPGDWLTITGPSGSGKSTMLMLLLGQLAPLRGEYRVNGVPAGEFSQETLRGRIAWCPQEGHLFNSTLRGNMLIARPRDDAPDDTELLDVLHRVGLGPLLERLPLGLDTPIGSAGSHLSGGERQRVAVARTLLARADVVLLDEPTAHLDEESAGALMTDLRSALADRITVLVTHHESDVHDDDRRIELGVRRAPLAGVNVSGLA